MTSPYEQTENTGHFIDHERQRVLEVLTSGTDDLLQTAVVSTKAVIRDVPTAQSFLREYTTLSAYRHANDGQFPTGIFPGTAEAVVAIDALKAARTQNIMADPQLSASYNNDRQTAANSFLITGIPVEVVEAALQQLPRH